MKFPPERTPNDNMPQISNADTIVLKTGLIFHLSTPYSKYKSLVIKMPIPIIHVNIAPFPINDVSDVILKKTNGRGAEKDKREIYGAEC